MNLTRYLKPPRVNLEIRPVIPEFAEEVGRRRIVDESKQAVLKEIVPLLESSGNIVNATKLLTDLWNREKKASTAVGNGLAIPHVRTMQARKFTLAFARSTPGVEFDAPDGQPVHFLFAVVAPPYDDDLYLKVYREIALVFKDERRVEELRATADGHEAIRILGEAYRDRHHF